MALEHLLKPRITELGKIKIGMKGQPRKGQSGRDWQPPVKLDHFLLTKMTRGEDGNYVVDDDLMRSLAHLEDRDGKLRTIPIGLLSNDIEEVLQVRYTSYVGKRLAAESDGVTLTSHYDFNKRQWLKEPREKPWLPDYAELVDEKKAKLFKLNSKFACVINAAGARFGGIYSYRSTSVISANQLYGTLKHISDITGGVLRGLPLRLVVRPMQVSPNGQATTVHVVHCELLASDIGTAQTMALERARFEIENKRQIEAARKEYTLAITSGKDDPEDVPEFFPEAGAREKPPAEVDPLLAGVVNQDSEPPPLTEEELEALERKNG